jgi:hypothetical protein
MYIIRFYKKTMRINICNLCPNIELISPIYFSNAICHIPPSQQAGIEDIMEASFEIVPVRFGFKCVLLYKLRRKYATKTDSQSNNSTAPIKNTATNTYLLVVRDVTEWDAFYVCLIECADEFTWDEEKLYALHRRYNYRFYMNYNDLVLTWLTCDETMMKIGRKVTYGSEYKLDIILSEGTVSYDMKKPMKIDPTRLVITIINADCTNVYY